MAEHEYQSALNQRTSSSFQLTGEEIIAETGLASISIEIVGETENSDSLVHLPARVVVTASDGSHPDGSIHGVYADGRFFVEGNFTVTVPPGETEIFLQNGPNYVPLSLTVLAEAGKKLNIRAILHRWFSPEERGWYGGDNHVHSQHDHTANMKTGLAFTALQGRANGLSYITEAGSHVSYDTIEQLSTENFLLKHADELKSFCFSGHLNTPGISAAFSKELLNQVKKQPLPALQIAELAHQMGGIVIYTHPLTPAHQLHWMGAAEVYSHAVLGKCADAFDIDSHASELLWYSILNLGNKLPCSSYTDSCLERFNSKTPGDRRVYSHAKEFSYEAIVEAIRAGRTFATNGGPVFAFFTIDGHESGDTIRTSEAETHFVKVEIRSLYSLKKAELYRRGTVVQSFETIGQQGEIVFTHTFQECDKSWYIMRVEDERGNWCMTSPIYIEPEEEKQKLSSFSSAILFEISNHTRFIHLRQEFFAHLIVTVSPDDPLTEVQFLKDEKALKSFTPDQGDCISAGALPVTELDLGAPYSTGWTWHLDSGQLVHFQADYRVEETGWYAVRVTTKDGKVLQSDAVYFDQTNPYSQELSVAHLRGEDTRFDLWGCGEEMLLTDIREPYEDRWWYPNNTGWRIKAQFAEQIFVLQGDSYEPSSTSTEISAKLVRLFKPAEYDEGVIL